MLMLMAGCASQQRTRGLRRFASLGSQASCRGSFPGCAESFPDKQDSLLPPLVDCYGLAILPREHVLTNTALNTGLTNCGESQIRGDPYEGSPVAL